MMDSGSSSSMQSSSGGGGGGGVGGGGGDEEFDSRNNSISSFLNRHQSSDHFGSISNLESRLLSHQPPFFDHSNSQNLDHIFPQSLTTQNANVQYNNEMVWSQNLRSEANYGDFGNLKGSSSSLSSTSLSSSSHSLLGTNQAQAQTQLASSSQSIEPNVTKNPKKRTRASRRAPTTVLTTDTANFRQMVQEFTGIPSSPFSATSPYSRRLDLFSTAGSAMRGGPLDTLTSLYPLRPSVQKAPQSSPSPSLLFNSSVINANNNISNTTNNSFQVPQILGNLQKQPQNLLNMQNQNQFLNFQTNNLPPSSIKLPMGDDHQAFLSGSLNHQHGFSIPESVETRSARSDENTPRWRDGGTHEGQQQQQNLGAFDGNSGNISGLKLKSSSSSEFNPEKVLDNGSSGGLEFTNYN